MTETRAMSQAEFDALSPFERGYATYALGAREDQPHVPDESNPYEAGTWGYKSWNKGQQKAALDAQDGDD